MFNSNNNKKNNTTVSNSENFSANTIQTGTTIDGQINSEGSIRIDGILTGSITTKAKLVVGKTGVITGDIFCQNASIEGKVEGKIEVKELLDLKESAKVYGDIFTRKLVVEPGAVFNGACKMESGTNNASISGKGNIKHKKAV